jgi:ribosome assembly protein YihI (activator of Der GTPase)
MSEWSVPKMPSTSPSKRTSGRSMSDEHKAALAQGRQASNAVRRYLDALEASRPRRGRKRTPASVQEQLDKIEVQLRSASAFERLNLLAEAERLQASLDQLSSGEDLGPLRDDFIKYARIYGEAKGISYATWRAAGVSAADLKAAGITRGR